MGQRYTEMITWHHGCPDAAPPPVLDLLSYPCPHWPAQAVDGSYVLVKGKVHKVPANDVEALRSGLMGLFEKRRARGFFL